MKERPILFSGAMVRAILEGRKTQTRRVMIPQPSEFTHFEEPDGSGEFTVWWDYIKGPEQTDVDQHYEKIVCPYGKVGDRLWVRETWGTSPSWDCIAPSDLPISLDRTEPHCAIQYAASDSEGVKRWRPSIHMPRRASRITLDITSIRVERVQEISEVDAIAEGVEEHPNSPHPRCYCDYMRPDAITGFQPQMTAAGSFRTLWDSINAKRGCGWDTNPWVWVIEFKRV